MANDSPAAKLRSMIGQDHFAGEKDGSYTGVHDLNERASLNIRVDLAAEALALASDRKATESKLLEVFKLHLLAIDRDSLDTEDAEHVGTLFEQMLDALGIESSGGLLNTWMYGFDPS